MAPKDRVLIPTPDDDAAVLRAPLDAGTLGGLLVDLGLVPYQARVLLALLRLGSADSSQLAKLSGVPRTSIYKVIDALIAKGLAFRLPTPGAAIWASPGWEEVIDVLEADGHERHRHHQARAARLRQAFGEVLPAAARPQPR